MLNRAQTAAATLTLAAAASPLLAQSDVDPSHKFSWGENIGFMNWRDANAGAQGVMVHQTFLSGFVWGENVGWINLGDGSPADGVFYANLTGADAGVNIDHGGDLFGLAWGENIGWINFDTRAALGPFDQQARLDRPANRFRGFAWGENVGWINLDDGVHYVGLLAACPADWDNDGVFSSTDFFAFLNDFFAGDADFNGNGATDATDFFDFLSAFFAGC